MPDNLMDQWTAKNTTEAISQIKDAQTFIYQKFFKKSKGHNVNTIEVPIRKGSGVILISISPDADHIVHDRGDRYMLDIKLPRFALSNPILASELNALKQFDSMEERKISLAKIIGEITQEHKSSYLTTIEYMSAGALFGKIMDGEGKLLFELETTRDPVIFEDDPEPSQDPLSPMRDIDEMLADEFGADKSYVGLASREFMDKLWFHCKFFSMDEKNQAMWIEQEGKRCLQVQGTTVYPYSVKYKNAKGEEKPFIPQGEAVFIPQESDAFEVHYGRADHIEAVKNAAKQFFGTTEPLRQGKGFDVLTETKTIPVCVRPTAVIKAKYGTV